MFGCALGAARALTAAVGLAFGAAAAQAAPEDEFEGFDSAPRPVLYDPFHQPTRSAFDLGIDGDGATHAGRLHRSPAPLSDVAWLPRQRLSLRGTLMRAHLSEDASLSVRLRPGRLSVTLAIRLPM